jgi:hypothetical protein
MVGLALTELYKILRNVPVRRIHVIERRRLPRTKVALPAKILAEHEDAVQSCTVENLNTQGACISFDAATFAELPHKFELTFDNCHTYWHCNVIWQDGDVRRVGVSWRT